MRAWNILCVTTLHCLTTACLTRPVPELFEDDALIHLQQWLSPSRGSNGRSKLLVLVGRSSAHWPALKEALSASSNSYVLRNVFHLDASQRPVTTVTTVTDWATSIAFEGKLPWSVVVISHAQKLSVEQVDELVNTFVEKQICENTEQRFRVECSKLLVVLSTNICEEIIVGRLPSLEPDEAESSFAVDEACGREVRQLWNRGMLYRGYKRFGKVVYGRADEAVFAGLVAYQTEMRRMLLKVKEGGVAERERSEGQANMVEPGFVERSGFIGQPDVVEGVKHALEVVRQGLKSGKGPMIFLFAGLPGTGKSFMSQVIARAYNGGERSDLTELERTSKYLMIDMGNYQDERAIDGFVDPSPGLQGEGLLSTLFQVETRTVVVLDEIEKAHPSLLKDMLLPVLDNNDGHVQKKKTGEKFATKEAIFILTTNCFDDTISTMAYEGKSYGEIVNKLSLLFQDPKARCLSAHPENANPFAWGPLWRRIVAGQAYAMDQELFAFLPPRDADLKEQVRQTLEHMHVEFAQSDSGICGLFYTRKALALLQSQFVKRSSSTTSMMATVGPRIQNTVASAVMKAKLTNSATDGGCIRAVIYVDNHKRIAVASEKSPRSEQKCPEMSSQKPEKPQHKPLKQRPSKTEKGAPVKDKAALDVQVNEDIDEKLLESVEASSSWDALVEQARELTQSVQVDRMLELLLFWALMLGIAYWFILPLLKTVAVLFAATVALVAYFDPQLALQLIKLAATVVMFVLRLIGAGAVGMVPLALVIVLWIWLRGMPDGFNRLRRTNPVVVQMRLVMLALSKENQELRRINRELERQSQNQLRTSHFGTKTQTFSLSNKSTFAARSLQSKTHSLKGKRRALSR